MNLCDLELNKKAIIDNIYLHGIKKRRLYDLGFIPGESIYKMFNSIYKNPKCYKIKNTFLALRDEDAVNIEVHYE